MDSSLAFANRWRVWLAIKRLIDLFGAVTALALLSPILLIVGLLLALDRRGSILFRQTRIGEDGKPFELLKFRTMHSAAEESLQEYLDRDPDLRLEYTQRQKLIRDPRLTRLGRFLRCSSLDETPQLWNVLRGEMSLVGPRPFLPGQSALYGPAIHFYTQVRPGLTGLWQVSGRNRLSFQERVRLDIDYVVHWTLWLDLAILLRTPWVVITRLGAY